MLLEAFQAGFWASVGSAIGKLSGTQSLVGDSYIIWGALLSVMVVANTWGCRHYLRALSKASNSVTPTVVSAACSYVLSGLIGALLFGEGAIVRRWGAETFLIIAGLALIARGQKLKSE